jgi:hypothetical protein
MKTYPKIEKWSLDDIGKNVIIFDKIDGSNLRFSWSKKTGWYKFGTRKTLINKDSPIFGESIDLFMNKYSEDLDKLFKDKYKSIINFTVYCEFFGENSFAGEHFPNDKKDLKLFEVNAYKRGFIEPFEFVKSFSHLDIPDIIYEGKLTSDIIDEIENSNELKEGGIIKGWEKRDIFLRKVKTKNWLEKLKHKWGEESLIEDYYGKK